MPDTLLRRPQVQEITGLPTSTLYALMADGHFPRPLRPSPGRVAWRRSDLDRWLKNREEEAGLAAFGTEGGGDA